MRWCCQRNNQRSPKTLLFVFGRFACRPAALPLPAALAQRVAQATGHAVLPIESAQLEQLVSTGLTVAATLVSWWKNNSFTPEAIEADDYFYKLKSGQ